MLAHRRESVAMDVVDIDDATIAIQQHQERHQSAVHDDEERHHEVVADDDIQQDGMLVVAREVGHKVLPLILDDTTHWTIDVRCVTRFCV